VVVGRDGAVGCGDNDGKERDGMVTNQSITRSGHRHIFFKLSGPPRCRGTDGLDGAATCEKIFELQASILNPQKVSLGPGERNASRGCRDPHTRVSLRHIKTHFFFERRGAMKTNSSHDFYNCFSVDCIPSFRRVRSGFSFVEHPTRAVGHLDVNPASSQPDISCCL
jgi:hypothetical protein